MLERRQATVLGPITQIRVIRVLRYPTSEIFGIPKKPLRTFLYYFVDSLSGRSYKKCALFSKQTPCTSTTTARTAVVRFC